MAYLTVRQVATALRMDAATIYRLIRGGHLPSVRLGTAVRIPTSVVATWLDDEIKSQTALRMQWWATTESANHGHA